MCGLVGFIGTGDASLLDYMTDSLAHRGPDERGTYIDSAHAVFLGHRRLSIIDLDGGQQPMWDEATTVCVVFNGEIYNHAELRAELIARGHKFITNHSDTEVLVKGYQEWGSGLPEKLNGMFAFVIYDTVRKQLFMARDRFGEKPLYYASVSGLFAFSSELRTLIYHPGISPKINLRSVQKFFAYGYIPSPNALYENCYKLPAGGTLIYDLETGTISKHQYWQFSLEPDDAYSRRSDNDLAEELRHLLIQAVDRRLISDVPIGFFLSGGIDSSAIVAAAAHCRSASSLKTFTIGFDEPSFDESVFARDVAQHIGTAHHEVCLKLNDVRDLIPEILSRMDEPLGDPSVLPTYLLASMTRQNVSVALTGDGGDELFAGYDPFSAMGPASFYARFVPQFVHRGICRLADFLPVSHKNMSAEFKIKRALLGLSYSENLWNPVWMSLMNPDMIAEMISEPIHVEDLYSEALELWDRNPHATSLERSLEFFTTLYLQDNILTKTDRASMMNSLETRAIFLDNDLVDFARHLPMDQKIRNGKRKYILKNAVKDWLPDHIIDRRKKGFGIPIGKWMRESMPDEPTSSVFGIYDNCVEQYWQSHRSGQQNNRMALWGFLAMQHMSHPGTGQ